jgi:hypothetical protein
VTCHSARRRPNLAVGDRVKPRGEEFTWMVVDVDGDLCLVPGATCAQRRGLVTIERWFPERMLQMVRRTSRFG